MKRSRGGSSNSRLTHKVLETYGAICWLKLPGCKTLATTKDHLIPVSHGGDDSLENLRPACKPCNSKRQNKALAGYGARVVIIMGAPASGKTTYVETHAKDQDVIIDFDKIASVLAATKLPQTEQYPNHIRHVAVAARKNAIRVATRLKERVTVWIIHSIPTLQDLEEYKALGYQIIRLDPGRAVVEERCRTLRSPAMLTYAAKYYALHGKEKQIILEKPNKSKQYDGEDW